jgi:hypothetical protein
MPAPDRFRSAASGNQRPAPAVRGVRRQSSYEYLGLPLWAIATGPDSAKGEIRGHTKGVLALGDIATGVVAIGGFVRGVIAFGGLAVGIVASGGLAIGGLAFGGLAIGAFALGGAAVGGVAIGGIALGIYAVGGIAWSTYVISAAERSPEAIAFFTQFDALRAFMPPLPRR